jgi:hypothetical protein
MSGEQEASAALKPPRPLGSPRSFTLPARLYFVSFWNNRPACMREVLYSESACAFVLLAV